MGITEIYLHENRILHNDLCELQWTMNEFYIIYFNRNQYSPQEGILFLFNYYYLWPLFIVIIIIIIIIIIIVIIIIIIIIITITNIFCRSAIV